MKSVETEAVPILALIASAVGVIDEFLDALERPESLSGPVWECHRLNGESFKIPRKLENEA